MTKPNNNEYDIKEYDIYLILLKIIEDKERAKNSKCKSQLLHKCCEPGLRYL